MAYQEYGMWEVIDVLKRRHAGESIRKIARNTGRSRNTVRDWLAKAEELGWMCGQNVPDDALAQAVMEQTRPGRSSDTQGDVEALLMIHAERIREWLQPDPFDARTMQLTKVWKLLARQGVIVNYGALWRFAHKHLGFGQKQLTVRMADVAPGEVAEVDFGRLGLVPFGENGEMKVLHALVVTLVYSRHQYVYTTHSQKLPALLAGLDAAWQFFGGRPRRVIIDNMKSAVTKADRYDPVFHRTFSEYAAHHGFTIDAAEKKSPTHKPHVERGVPYVRENFFRGERFLSRDQAQQAAERWCLETAGKRVHGTTRRRPLEEFAAFEKPALLAANGERFDPPEWAELKVHPDCHIRFGNALYSVPHAFVGRKVTVRADSALVRIHVNGVVVKVHERHEPGHRSTDYNDYPAEKSAYAMRNPARLVKEAQTRGEGVGKFATLLLGGDCPWAHLRQAQKLLRLCDRYGNERMNEACHRALSFDIVNVRRVQTIVEQGLKGLAEPPSGTLIQLPLRNLRLNHSFQQIIEGGD
jgi:transposase